MVHHRFIILRLERDDNKVIWLRIDRRRDKSQGMLGFIAAGATSPANDEVSAFVCGIEVFSLLSSGYVCSRQGYAM